MAEDGAQRSYAGQEAEPPPDALGGGIERDEIDLRDRFYEPTLAQLRASYPPEPRLVARILDASDDVMLPRHQGDEGTCGGQALAAVIDIQRILASGDPGGGAETPPPVSARMIYQMAVNRIGERGPAAGVTLREVIKSFYNYGVCGEADWPYAPNSEDRQLNFARARNAKGTSLGAYYRLRPNLNAYHAALHETGAILVSAELHKGWRAESVAEAGGVIRASREFDYSDPLAQEKHAFVIVGYTPKGFIVLNSWGREWGCLPDPATGEPIPGLALWGYDDWADRILDGWVLRLGVGAAEAFDYSIGDQGLGFGGEASVRSTPVHAILGHFLHCDDGQYVPHGRFPSDGHTLNETFRLLEEDAGKPRTGVEAKELRRYDGVLLTFAGGILGLADAAEQVARWKHVAKSARWYPITALWCVDYVDQTRSVLETVFAEGLKRFGKQGAQLDRFIEASAHGVGRALWRDVEKAADIGSRFVGQRERRRDDGSVDEEARAPFDYLVWRLARMSHAVGGGRLRVIVESEGAIALSCLLRALERDSLRNPERAGARRGFFAMLESVDVVAPPMSVAEYEEFERLVVEGWRSAERAAPRLRLHLPGEALARRLEVTPYGKSYPDLVVNAFHARGANGAAPSRPVSWSWARRRKDAACDLVAIEWPEGREPAARTPIRQTDLLYRSDVGGRIRAALA